MRAICAASAAVLGAAALALTPPAATAADGKATPLFTVSPSTVAPGGRVSLSARGCSSTATASSGVFDAVTMGPGTSAVATVDRDARRGALYSVQFTCGSQRGSFNLAIAGGSASPTISSTSSVSAPATPQGVRGGLGGSVGEVDAGNIAIGAGLVLAATGAATLLVRRRAADDRRH
ncbi:hypothetical protein [Streptomyces sp. NPDC001985]|uniref:hypothetical protein n=1 Tax=Streptomyces sp. NPDC001985 TaxID=3154406 RepID=UPI00332556E4